MKTISETRINKSNRSLISTIPNTIVSLESLTNKDGIRWSYKIINNKHQYTVEFIKDLKKKTENNENKVDKTTENTVSNIDEPIEKPEKNNTDVLYFNNDEYYYKITGNKQKFIRVYDKNSSQITSIGITKRKNDEVTEITNSLIQCLSEQDIKKTLKRYRPQQ